MTHTQKVRFGEFVVEVTFEHTEYDPETGMEEEFEIFDVQSSSRHDLDDFIQAIKASWEEVFEAIEKKLRERDLVL